MMCYIFLCFIILLTCLDLVVLQYDSGIENDLANRQLEKERKISSADYNDYSEFRNHKNFPGREMPNDRLRGAESQTSVLHAEVGGVSREKNLFKLVPDWPDPNARLGQLSSVSIDNNGNIVVFHRGDRMWGSRTFLTDNTFTEISLGPIKQNTVVVFNASTGHVVYEWGNNMFYLPHGLTVDLQNNVWITDVALHQVFMFRANEWKKPSLILGTKFEPGVDDTHFCKPTDVAILSNGDFFVSDGYCNNRIIKYDSNGQKLMEWGRNVLQASQDGIGLTAYTFSVPHALTVAEQKETLFLADRENGRILSFNITSGYFLYEIRAPEMGSRLFSVAYTPSQGGQLFVVNGPDILGNNQVGGFRISLTVPKPIIKFTASFLLKNPHDIAVTTDGHNAYIVELNPFKIWKFSDGNKTFPIQPQEKSALRNDHNSSIKQLIDMSKTLQLKNSMDSVTQKSSTEGKRLGAVAMAVSIVLAVAVIVSIVIIAAITRLRKRGGSRHLDSVGHEYSKLVR